MIIASACASRSGIHAGHDLPVHDVVLVEHGTVPKTSCGKTQRRLCRDLYLQGRLAPYGKSMPRCGEVVGT